MFGALTDTPVGVLDPRSAALAQMGLGLMASSGPSMMPVSLGSSLGKAGMQGMQAYQQAMQANQQNQMFQMKMAEAQKQEAARKQQEEAMQQFRAQFPNFGALSVLDPKLALQRAFPEQQKPQFIETVDENGRPVKKAVVPQDGAMLPGYRAELDPNIRKAKIEDAVEQATAIHPLKVEERRAGKTDVNVSTDSLGLKPKDRFDMEGKLRDDFRANPTVKAADEMQSAYKLIETAAKSPSPANDMAMATKYMKILDPGSVVRESELAMAMNTSGLFDRVENYAKMIVSGQKLTPKQREDFLSSAKAINDSFQSERNSIASRFSENASQYNLSPDNVVGAPKVSEPQKPTKPSMSSMPPAAQHKGKIIEDSKGKRYRSDGMSWRPM